MEVERAAADVIPCRPKPPKNTLLERRLPCVQGAEAGPNRASPTNRTLCAAVGIKQPEKRKTPYVHFQAVDFPILGFKTH